MVNNRRLNRQGKASVLPCCFVLMALVVFSTFFTVALAGAEVASEKLSPFPSVAEQRFLEKHWPASIALQGTVPESYSALESSLDPKDCGSCHIRQFKDWQTSIHSRAMGPGMLGQLVDMVESDPVTARICWSCHTPLAEQQDLLQDKNGEWQSNPLFDRKLQHQGLVCAACHVRQHQRYGPPRRASPDVTGKITIADEGGKLPHNGFTAQSAFGKSAFCSGCHQFGPDDYALNGKPIENTYQEWKQSDYPEKNVQCQTCHMPDRRHLWRGIHDPAMVKSGVDIDTEAKDLGYVPGKIFSAAVSVTNSGVGHYFPTYLTPQIVVQGYFIDSTGAVIQHSLQEAVIGRGVTLDLSQELFDTRIPPGKRLDINYDYAMPREATHFRIQIKVYPDHFYTRFYESALADSSPSKGRKLLEEALVNSRESAFVLHEKTVALTNVSIQTRSHASVPLVSNNIKGQHAPDWNDKEVRWLDYDEGLQQAKLTGKPILLLLYADWCATCHAYKSVFYNPKIVSQAEQLIMVRVNIDQLPMIDAKYQLDGEYVPRTFSLDINGNIIHSAQARQSYPRHFISPDDIDTFIKVMGLAVAKQG